MLDKKTVAALRHKWDYINPEKNDFLNFEDFLEFAEESGFRDGLVLTRLRPSEPHSRENTRFMTRGQIRDMRIEQRQKRRQCEAEELAQRWNRCVHEPFKHLIPVPEKKPQREFFRYEHPDIIRRKQK